LGRAGSEIPDQLAVSFATLVHMLVEELHPSSGDETRRRVGKVFAEFGASRSLVVSGVLTSLVDAISAKRE
jgi:hypothetical protein